MISLSTVVWKIEPRAFQLFSKNSSVYEIAIVSDRQLAAGAINHKRLRVFQVAGAGRRVPNVTNGAVPSQIVQFFFPKNLGH